MKTNQVIILGIIGLGLFYLNSKPKFTPFSFVPPRPVAATGTDVWASWVNSVVNIYGNVRGLWDLGGPFYNDDIQAFQDIGIDVSNLV